MKSIRFEDVVRGIFNSALSNLNPSLIARMSDQSFGIEQDLSYEIPLEKKVAQFVNRPIIKHLVNIAFLNVIDPLFKPKDIPEDLLIHLLENGPEGIEEDLSKYVKPGTKRENFIRAFNLVSWLCVIYFLLTYDFDKEQNEAKKAQFDKSLDELENALNDLDESLEQAGYYK